MTAESPTADHESVAHDAATASAPHAPEFDNVEIAEFGKDDGTAVTVIGKMLVSFFFYSLIVMLAVGYWTYRASTAPAHAPAAHDVDEEE